MTASASSRPSPLVGLYVHFPFCVSICPYCDFVVVAGSEARGPRNRIDLLVAALMVEIDLRADALDARFGRPGRAAGRRPALGSLYIGGGTPSLLGPDALGAIIERVRRRYGLVDGRRGNPRSQPGPR